MTSTLDAGPSSVDPSVRPQDDLFRHVNGRWLSEVAIPADQSGYGAFTELRDRSDADCRAIIEEVAAEQAAPGSPERLIGELYASFMDSATVEKLGMAPLAGQLREVDAVNSVEELFAVAGKLHRSGVGGLFAAYVDTDPDDPDSYVVNLVQDGLGLPDESYYRDESYREIRSEYAEAIQGLLALAGVTDPIGRAVRIAALEMDLAAGHWDRVRCRDRTQTFNPRSRAELNELLPARLWDAWLSGLRAPDGVVDRVIVRQPDYFTALSALLTADRLPALKDHLGWNVICAAAPYGPEALVQTHFDFFGRVLSGTPELKERWKRGVGLVESAVGEALGRLYVQRHFPPDAKGRMDGLVTNLIAAYRRSIADLEWMTQDTKAKALVKLAAFNPKVGYPKRWRDYGALTVQPGDLLGNVRRAAAFELDRDLAKIGAPVDRDEWFMTPQTVNAYYNPGMNEIVFPAAILRPPFFDPEADDATNYGGIGAVIGHEIGHGFDDQGSKSDGSGAQLDWWTAQDRASFDALTARLIEQYSALEPLQAPGKHVNGALTVGENIGDLGGLGIAYAAWLISLGPDPDPAAERAGARRLFLSWAGVWRAKMRDAEMVRRLAIDPHAPAEFRCNQVLRNLDEFYRAFDVTPGDALWLDPAARVRIW